MTAAIRFTLPADVTTRDLPAGLRPLANAGPAGSTILRSESPLVHVQMLADWALGRGIDLPDLDVGRPTLEDVYLSLTASTEKDHR
jgi:ABC-2 type transport system ATP-binding protein